MPSVRVRRSDNYLRIRDDELGTLNARRAATERQHGRPRSRTLNCIFGEELLRPPQLGPEELETRSINSTASSKHDTQILEEQRAISPVSGPSETPEFDAIQGPNVELLIPAHPQPGLVGSTLHLPEQSVTRLAYDDGDHHEDDIVEHLEAIDPQIATVANLSNATNSILIPPLSFINRRPVISLPRRPDVEILTDTEKGKEKSGKPDYDKLDQHVDDVLSKKARIRRTLQGLWTFIKTPQGAITAIYGFLCAFWGAAIVLFLGRLINLHNANLQGFWVEVSSQVENGLFTATGVGFIPWRAIDTYRIIKIWRFKRLTRRLREKAGLPALVDEDDLPDPKYDPNYVHVLSDGQQSELQYQQFQFQKSQTWYRPHGTSTHRAFPINTALLICLLIDGNSFFQCLLCGCMWGLNRFERPPWTTGTLIPASFLCGIFAAVFIWRGGQQTRRTKQVEDRLKAALMFEKQTGLPAGITVAAAGNLPPIKAKTVPPTGPSEELMAEDARATRSEAQITNIESTSSKVP